MGRAMARRVPGAGQFAGTSAAIAAEEACDLGPAALTADGTVQGEHWIDVGSAPAHPGALEASFDDQLVGTLDDAAADRKALGAEGGVLDLVGPAGEGDKAGTSLPLRSRWRQAARTPGDRVPRAPPRGGQSGVPAVEPGANQPARRHRRTSRPAPRMKGLSGPTWRPSRHRIQYGRQPQPRCVRCALDPDQPG